MRSRAVWIVLAAAVVPRLVVLAHERGRILTAFTEKSDDFAQTFVSHGTFGLVPGEPSAYTQPLYGFFLVPLYWIFGRHWVVVGLAQTAVAAATALLVYAIARRILSPVGAAAAAVIATLDPYLIWHDVHVNREIVDQLVAAALVLLTLLAVERRSALWAAAAGVVAGIAVLGNTRLALLPLVLAAYVLGRLGRRGLVGAAALVVAAGIAVMPWLVRNRVEVGCFALTTDARALWKANNPQTYGLLASGRWIDDVRDLPAGQRPFPNPEEERDLYRATGRKVHADECDAMVFYQRRVWHFWRDESGEKAKLMGQAARMEWDPRPTRTTGRPGKGTGLDTARDWAAPAYASILFALGLVGLVLVPRWFAALVVALLAYQTLAAMVFVGATRYRVPWDVLVAVLAGATVAWALERVPLARRLAPG